jgi:hypothetical protein
MGDAEEQFTAYSQSPLECVGQLSLIPGLIDLVTRRVKNNCGGMLVTEHVSQKPVVILIS